MTEQELTKRLKEGDNMARKALYERFAGNMMSLCLRYVGNRDEAEDVLHDGFLHVFSVISKFKFRGEGSLGGWLHRVFTNYVLNYLENERKLMVDDVESLPEPEADDTPPPDISAEEIITLMNELPPGYRTVLNLFLVEGWSHAEIAAKLNIKENSSASQYLRGKKMLKEKIIQYLKTKES